MPNREAGAYNWRNPNNRKITTAAEAQELVALHFAVCITNPGVIQRRLERQEDAANRRQMEEAAEARAANAQSGNVQRAGDQQAAPKPHPLMRPIKDTETTKAEPRQLTKESEAPRRKPELVQAGQAQ